jgi:hypothetical protein
MQTARRLYLYAMSAVTLGVIAAGLATLLDVFLTGTGLMRHTYGASAGTRELLSRAIAMLGVSVPVWAVHWWLVSRSLAPGRPDREAERSSAIRATYLTLVLFVSLLFGVNGVADIVRWIVISPSSLQLSYSSIDPVDATTMAVVGIIAWSYHWFVRGRDLAAGPLRGPAEWIPRLYLYGIGLLALVVSLSSLDPLVTNLIVQSPGDEGFGQVQVVDSAVNFLIWGLVWAGHWYAAGRRIQAADWRGAEERLARTRTAAFIATIAVATAFTIAMVAGAVQAGLAPLIGRVPYELNQGQAQIAGSLVSAIAWAIAWFTYVRWLRDEPSAADQLRALHHRRLETHATAATALAFGATGLGWLLGMGVDAAFGGERMTDPNREPWTFELSLWLPMAIVGLGVWAWQWARVIDRWRRDPAGEANSTIRRTFLFLTLAVGLVVAIAATALILYRLIGSVIGAQFTGNAVSALSTPIGALLVVVVLLAYHGLLLRADMALRDAGAGTGLGPVAAVGVGVAESARAAGGVAPGGGPTPRGAAIASSTVRRLELVGPEGANADAALAAARAALPEGFRLEEPAESEDG